jgi:hypothetical protein
MGDQRRTPQRNAGAFLSPTDIGGGMIPMPMNSLTVGPGEPGPEDEWKMPLETEADDTKAATSEPEPAAIPEPEPVARPDSLLHRLTHRG